MNLSINGQSQVPPGFRFHPTEEELLHYYLRKKVSYEKIDLDVIREVDLNKLEPWDIQEKCRIGSTPQNDWYFFSHKDKKYPTGTRTNRATAAGFWKATGRDKIICSGFTRIGLRKTLVFYKGRAPHGQKSDWIMHEYRLEDNSNTSTNNGFDMLTGDSMNGSEDSWVICRVFKKKNYQKIIESPKVGLSGSENSDAQMLRSSSNGILDQILLYMERGNGNICKSLENQMLNNNRVPFGSSNNIKLDNGTQESLLHERFMHLPRLETSNLDQPTGGESLAETGSPSICGGKGLKTTNSLVHDTKTINRGDNWVNLDRLVARQLNGQVDMSEHKLSSRDTNSNPAFEDDEALSWHVHWRTANQLTESAVYSSENIDLWDCLAGSSSSPSSSDPLRHLFV